MSAKRAAASKPERFAATQQTKKPAARAASKARPSKTTAARASKAAPAKAKSPSARSTKAPVRSPKPPVRSTKAPGAQPSKAKAKAPVKAPSINTPKRTPKLVSAPAEKPAAPKVSAAAASAPAPARKSAPTKRAAKPVKAAPKVVAPTPASTGKEKSTMQETAKPAARAVVRIARGLRTPKHAAAVTAEKDTPPARGRGPAPSASVQRRVGPKIEVNPRLERSKHLVKSAPTADAATAPKPMSVAAKHRAAAEAVFARLTVPEAKPAEGAPAEAPTPLPFSARPPDQGGGSYTMRVNEHDSAVTALRLANGHEETLAAARHLADKFKLPPDQSLLLRVVALGDAALTKLALEELLELEDRGRVRPSPELKSVLGGVESNDPETREIKQLLLEKIGVH